MMIVLFLLDSTNIVYQKGMGVVPILKKLLAVAGFDTKYTGICVFCKQVPLGSQRR